VNVNWCIGRSCMCWQLERGVLIKEPRLHDARKTSKATCHSPRHVDGERQIKLGNFLPEFTFVE